MNIEYIIIIIRNLVDFGYQSRLNIIVDMVIA